MPFLIIAQSEVTASALWQIMGGGAVSDPRFESQCILLRQFLNPTDKGVNAFTIAADRIESHLADAGRMPTTVIVDSVASDAMNPIDSGDLWNSVLALLVLAFPEVNWVFGEDSSHRFTEWHSLFTVLDKPLRNPLFDPTGLRNVVRENANKKGNCTIPTREKLAAAIDEEVHYALFHAYTAYRFGYRADAVTSWKLMEKLFGVLDGKKHEFHLLLEDVNLYFPDRPAKTHLSTFEKFEHNDDGDQGRAEHCAKLGYGRGHQASSTKPTPLESSEFRIIVTSGHSGASSDTMEGNRQYVKSHKKNGWGYVLKPTGGMFDLWAKARLFERLQPHERGRAGGSRPGLAPGFEWPPKPDGNNPTRSVAHSAPGKLMLVASHLVRRADALRAESNTVEECIRGAVLATEAVELLGYRTPTLALQALELKQWFETKAEVAFVGVGHHFQLTRRFKEIERETRVAARYYNKSRRDAAALDAAVTIANRLTLVFREAGQFDEEEACLRKLRWWNRKLSFSRARNKYHLLPGLGILAYAEWMISSLGWFLLSVAAWMLLITLIWWSWTQPGHSWQDAVQGAIGSFVGSSFETKQGFGILILSGFGSVLGFFHLGVFVSFLYSAIARK